MIEIPTLDAPRPAGNSEFGRVIIDYLGDLTPYIEETDSCVALPVRLVYDQAAAFQIELGPYSLDSRDIERLRAAIKTYDDAVGPRDLAL